MNYKTTKQQLTTENAESVDIMDKSDDLDRGGPGRVGDSGPNRSDTEPSDTFEIFFCGELGRGDSGGNPSDESTSAKPEKTNHREG